MVEERYPEHKSDVPDLLEAWRDAERDAEAETPGSAARGMARKRAEAAKRAFHEAEGEERERQGNQRPRNDRDAPA